MGMDAFASGSFVGISLSISLVKSDWKLQQKIGSPADLSPADALFRSWHARALVKMNFHIWYCPQQKKRI